jgi:hypothetical protein
MLWLMDTLLIARVVFQYSQLLRKRIPLDKYLSDNSVTLLREVTIQDDLWFQITQVQLRCSR